MPRQEEALAVWWVLALGFALGLLPRARPPRGWLIPTGALVLLAVWTAISLSWTQSDERTFAELARFLHYAGLLLLIWSVIDIRTWKAAAAGIMTAALAVSALALISRLAPSHFPTNYVGQNFKTNRLSYPFNYWNAVGAWTVMSMAMALCWSAHARRWAARAATLAAVPVCGAAAYMTYSRAAAIGTGLGIVLVLALSRNRWVALVHALAAAGGTAIAIAAIRSHKEIADATGSAGAWTVVGACAAAAAIAVAATGVTWILRGGERWRLPPRPVRIAVAAAVLAIAVLVPTAGHSAVARGWHEFRHQGGTTSSDPAARLSSLNGNRYFLWRSAVKAFRHAPVRGIGSGTFEFWWSRQGGVEFVRDSHSIYVEELGEQGLPGGLLIVVALGGLAGLALRSRLAVGPADAGASAALAAVFLLFLFHAGVDWMWESTAVSVLALSAAAVAAAALSQPASGRLWLPRRVGLAAFAVVAGLVQLPGLVSTSSVRDSQRAFSRGDIQAALRRANDAVESEPWAASPYAQRALVEEATDELDAARLDLIRAARREPTNFRHRLLLARVDAERGDSAEAVHAYEQAKALRPKSLLLPR